MNKSPVHRTEIAGLRVIETMICLRRKILHTNPLYPSLFNSITLLKELSIVTYMISSR